MPFGTITGFPARETGPAMFGGTSDGLRQRIFIVEDDGDLALVLGYNFEAAGYAVAWSPNGSTAIDRIMAEVPHLVVLDWMVPGLSGIEVLRRLRTHKATRSLPAIMLTGRVDRADRLRAESLRVDAFICKPFSITELMERTRKLLGAQQGCCCASKNVRAIPTR